MADTSRTVEIIFGGVDRTGGAISSVGKGLQGLEQNVGSITGPLAEVTDTILKVDAALALLAVAVIGFATKESLTFQAALIDLQKVMGEGEGAAEDYADQFNDLASRFGVEAAAVIQSTADFRQAGFDIADSLTLVEQSLIGVNAADLSAAESTELLIGTLAGFQKPASEAAHLLDVLNGVSNNAGTSVAELGEGFKILGPIANALGLSFEETAAYLTPVVEVTRSGSEAANALKTAISNLVKPTKEQRALLEEELGIQLELNGERRETRDVLAELIERTEGLTSNEKQRVAAILAGAEQMSRFLALLNGSARSEEILTIAMESSGSALKEFEVRTSSAEFALKQLQAAFTSAAATAGMQYIDQTTRVTQATTSLVDSFREAVQGENAAQLFDALGAGLDAFARQVEVIAENLPAAFEGLDFSDLLASFGNLGDEVNDLFGALFGDIDLSTVEGLESALQKLVDGVTALVNLTAGIASGLEPLFEGIGFGIEQFQNLDSAAQQSIGEVLGFAKALDSVLPVIGALGGGLESVGTGLTALAGASGLRSVLTQLDSLKKLGAGAGKFGLLGLALTGGVAVGEIFNQLYEEISGQSLGADLFDFFNADEIAEQERLIEAQIAKIRENAEANKEYNESIKRLDEIQRASVEAKDLDIDALQRHADALVEASKAQGGYADEIDRLGEADVGGAIGNLTQAISDNRQAALAATGTVGELAQNNQSLAVSYDESGKKINSFSGTIIKSGEAFDKFSKKTEKAIEDTEAFRLKMLEIASDERIANIEAAVSLNIAQLESDTDKAVAIIENLGTSISSTGDLLGGLFESFANTEGIDQSKIERQIAKENERRNEALTLQKRLTEEQIKQIRAKTQALANGNALIQVDGAGLQPHLEAFMFEILREIQVRVNADGGEQLLGLL